MGTTTHKGKGNGKRKGEPLTAKFVERAKEPGKYSDGQRGGHGLMLWVQPSGSRQWVQRIVIHGKRRDIGLGGYPVVTLAEARDRALANRRVARNGGDPRTQANPGVPTFEDATRKVHPIRTAGLKTEKSRKQWIDEVARYVWPSIGHLPVNAITTAQLTPIFEPIWTEKPKLAQRVRSRTWRILDWAMAQGYRPDNPAGSPLMANLPNQPEGEHHRAIHYSDLPEAIRMVRNSTSGEITKLAFEFLALTAVRRGEGLGARWDEIDMGARTWTIPASRMKAGREHRVPLSTAAMNVLARCEKVSDGRTGFVFQSPRSRAKPIDESSVNKMLKKAGIECSPHGLRSSFRDWGGETAKPREVLEAALAHKVANKTEAAYARSDLFDRRVLVMQAWADYVSG